MDLLLPRTTVFTPNSREARALAPEADSLEAAGQALLDRGCELVLITGTHEATPRVVNLLYGNLRQLESFTWDRLPGEYHGSGCTLASALAGALAHGLDVSQAVFEAEGFTWQSLVAAFRPGMGQYIPDRFFWVRPADDAPRAAPCCRHDVDVPAAREGEPDQRHRGEIGGRRRGRESLRCVRSSPAAPSWCRRGCRARRASRDARSCSW